MSQDITNVLKTLNKINGGRMVATNKTVLTEFVKALGEIKNFTNVKENPFFKSKYVPLDFIIDVITPIMKAHGFAIVQNISSPENMHGLSVTTYALHESGEQIESKTVTFPLPNNATPQSLGSITTYLRRYSLMAFIGRAGTDEDDDGNSSSTSKKKIYIDAIGFAESEDELKEIWKQISEEKFPDLDMKTLSDAIVKKRRDLKAGKK